MGSKKLPTIDFSKSSTIKQGTQEWDSMKLQVMEALEEYGCFEALYGQNQQVIDLQKTFFGSLEELFDLPTHVKELNISRKPFHGYLGKNPLVFEAIGIDRPDVIEDVEKLTNMFWPQGNTNFREAIHSMAMQKIELDHIVRRMICESLGIERYVEEQLLSTVYLLKVMRYLPAQTLTVSKIGLPPHTDKTMVTILCENQVSGLEVKSKCGDWIDINLSPGSFVVMVADALYAWTNGRVHNPVHQVIRKEKKTRYSSAIFSITRRGYMVKAPDELVDKQHPLLFKPFDQYEYFNFYYNNYHLKGLGDQGFKGPLYDYCGIKSND